MEGDYVRHRDRAVSTTQIQSNPITFVLMLSINNHHHSIERTNERGPHGNGWPFITKHTKHRYHHRPSTPNMTCVVVSYSWCGWHRGRENETTLYINHWYDVCDDDACWWWWWFGSHHIMEIIRKDTNGKRLKWWREWKRIVKPHKPLAKPNQKWTM